MLGFFCLLRKFSLSLVFSWFGCCFVGIFCSSKKLRQTKRSGGVVLCCTHTLRYYCCTATALWVGGCHIFANTCRERGEKRCIFFCLFLFRVVFVLQLLEFACLLRAVCNIYSRVLLLLHSSSPMGDCSYQSSL